MARPRKSEDELSMAMSLRLTEADYAAYMAKCRAAGLTRSEFLREYVLRNRTQVFAKAPLHSDMRRTLFLIGKSSNNINQLAHRANADYLAGTLGEVTYRSILMQLHSITLQLEGFAHVD